MFKTVTIITIILALFVFAIAPPAQAATMSQAIQDGADHVVSLQHLDGKWGWPGAPYDPNAPTYNNITGPLGLGLLSAYEETADAAHLQAAEAAGDSLVGLTADWVGTYNPMFLLKLYDATADPNYQAQADSFFTDLAAGTYTRQSVDHDTASWITTVQGGRSGTWVNLRPWEFAPQAYASAREGTAAQTAAFVQAIRDGIDTLDSSDPNTAYNDLLGLAGGVMGLASMGADHDPTVGAFASDDSLADLAATLAANQNANGSWDWHSALASPTTGDEDLQTTAYAVLALEEYDRVLYASALAAGRQYLVSTQLVDGGWPSYPPAGQEYAETDGEVIWALASIPVPSAGAAGLALLGVIGVCRRR